MMVGKQVISASCSIFSTLPDSGGASPAPDQSDRGRVLAGLPEKLAPFHSDIGRPSIDPELMARMLIVGYCYGICFERRLFASIGQHDPSRSDYE